MLSISAKNFDCNFQKVFVERRNETLLTCELKSVRYDEKSRQDFVITTNYSEIEKIMNVSRSSEEDYSDEETEKSLDDLVTQVKFKWSNFPSIPNQIFSKFKELIIFDGSGVDLKNLNSLSFNGAGNLEMIFLKNNQLTSLNAYCFVHSKNLTVLDLSKNKISKIQPLAFIALGKLETLILSNNNIKTVEDSTFQSLTSLKLIGLDNNRLSFVSSDLFVAMGESLEEINLNNNKIEMISPYAFNLLKQLKFMKLSGNRCVNKNFLNHNIQENTSIKFELRQCHKEYRKGDFSNDEKFSVQWNVDQLEKANKVCLYESMKIITELFDVQNQISNL